MEQFLTTALKEKSPAISAFWYGKFLQEIEQQRQDSSSDSRLLSATIMGKTLQDHIQDATIVLNTHQTSLSSGVHALVTSRPSSSLVDDLTCCVHGGNDKIETLLLNWDKVVQLETECDLGRHGLGEIKEIYLLLLGSVAKRLGVVASRLYREVENIEITDLIAQWRLNLTWTHNAEVKVLLLH